MEGPGAAPRPQALTGPLQTGMKVLGLRKLACVQAPPDGDERVPDAGRRRSAEDLHEQRPDASGDRGDRRERGNPPRPPVLGLLKGADADILHGQPLAVILELGDHDVVEALVRARDLGLEPGKLGLHFPDLADKPDVLFFAHRAASIPLNRNPHPPEPGTRYARRPGTKCRRLTAQSMR